MERRSSKEYAVVFLVEGKTFNLLNLPSTTSSLLLVLLPTRSAQRLSLAAVLRPNLAELVASVFSVHNHGFCGGPNRFPQEKHPCLS